jgi:hypothetical protein
LEAKRGTAYEVRSNRWSTGARLKVFCQKVQERKEEFERTPRSPDRRKALKSEAQECWELKEIPKDGEAKPFHREGSQTLG